MDFSGIVSSDDYDGGGGGNSDGDGGGSGGDDDDDDNDDTYQIARATENFLEINRRLRIAYDLPHYTATDLSLGLITSKD